MITLKLDLESTENYGMPIYKGDDSNFYMFNDCGDLVYKDKKTYGVKVNEVWKFSIGAFKINEDKIITQTQEYHDKYYVCDKAAYEESLKGSNSANESLKPKVTLDQIDYQSYEDYTSADGTDIEEEIQRVLAELKNKSVGSDTYSNLLTVLERLVDIREKI
jgi:hypothetical protein